MSDRVSAGVRVGLLLGCSLFTVSCKEPPTPTPPSPPPSLALSCPGNQSVVSHFNQPVTVTWPDPTAGGGVPALTTFCAPQSGTAFAASSTVNCFVLDSYNQHAACSFQVTVVRIPQLEVTKFVAFGDSLTEGKISLQAAPILLLAGPEAYPVKLMAMLSARYADQSFSVVDEGLGGERASDGVQRLRGVLSASRPEVLLLQEGANDLNSPEGAEAIPGLVDSLDAMIRMAQALGVRTFLGNQPPQRAGGLRAGGAPYVGPLNIRLAALAQKDGVPLVDLYSAINTAPDVNIGPDGLHLTDAGYGVMAQAFFDAIKNALESHTAR